MIQTTGSIAFGSMHRLCLPFIHFATLSIKFKARAHETRAHVPKWLLLALAVAVLVNPAVALDESDTLSPSLVRHHHSFRTPIGLAFGLIVLVGQYVVAFSGSLVGPMMGITSLLWLMMRNDAAISPKASWMVFGCWSFLTLTYFIVQCRRVSNHHLYILLTIALASICMCLVAIVQKSALQGGLVTAIPTCTSFAAYAVAYFFPDRYAGSPEPWDLPV